MEEILVLARELIAPRLREWRESGGRVVGYSCVATPREIFDAGGILPYRIRALGKPERDHADAHLSRFNCGFCRACLQLALEGAYGFLDGLVETNGCDHLRGMFENWSGTATPRFFHYLKVPHVVSEESLEFFAEELELLREALSSHFQVDIGDAALAEAVRSANLRREGMRRLFSLREMEHPALKGQEALAVLLLESSLPPGVFDGFLRELLEEVRGREITGYRARLLLAGSATDEPDLVREIEDLGGLVVTDAMCYGTRAFWKLPEVEGEPVHALAEAYLRHLLCPRMFDDYPSRLEFILQAAERARVDGAVLVYNKFCDLHGVENVRLRLDLEERGIPVLVLEKEYGSAADLGRIRTRVQAFLERIAGRRPSGKRSLSAGGV
ncbi:2-hydroxyacyl-CoA dehydratase family protein [Candidatus Solincola tengchongensis]|uniref:2-hydroxyacyl-CoA dehydratase subunit D n=1 Tax=Candidatus Solincola tengchongensis TaxID=2900693 RepID=UPI00257A58E7